MTTHADSGSGTLWRDGWYRFARRLDSPNFGARPAGRAIDLIVLHAISLPPGRYGGSAVPELFCNRLDCAADPYFETLRGVRVSAHFFITREGALWQFVGCGERAWHAGVSSWRGADNCNDNSIGIELEGLPGAAFESAQYESLGGLCAALGAHYPITSVAGHEHIAPGRKLDPGSGFEWRRLSNALGWPADFFAA